jgi:hypothetical protein
MSDSKCSLCLVCFFVAISCGWTGRAQPKEAKPGFAFEDYLLAPVRVHLLKATNAPHIETTLTEKDIRRILGKINRVWSQAGLSFYLESLITEEAAHQDFNGQLGQPGDLDGLLALRPNESKVPRLFHIYYIKQLSVNGVYLGEAIFVKDTAALKPVPGGIDEPIPRVTSHELGHALSLPHVQGPTKLMFRGSTGTNLLEPEIKQAREAARMFEWIEPAPVVMEKADELYRAQKFKEAKVWYARVGALTVEANQVTLAKKRALE